MSTRASGTDPGSKSAAEIEREVRQSRADIEQTLDAIQERLSPGQMVDQAIGYLRGGRGVDFARNLGDSIAANPLPVALLGVGVAWLMFSSQRSPRDDEAMRAAYWEDDLDAAEEHYAGFIVEEHETGFAEEDMGYLGPKAETGEGLGAQLKEAGESVKGTMAGLGERARDAGARVRHAGERARDRFGSVRAGAAERAHAARERVRRHGYRAKRGMLRTLDEQPLVLGAIGLAIGAALGAALPPTRTEDELMGDARDGALRRATRVGREQAEKLRKAAGAVATAAREEADRQASTITGSGEPGKEAAAHQSGTIRAAETGESRPTGSAADTPFPPDPTAKPGSGLGGG
jgi:hypothetical protein